jgi:hypothetical protein
MMFVWRASKYYLQQAVTPDQITQQNSLQRQEGPQGSQDTLRPLKHYLTFASFLKVNVTTKNRKKVVRKFRYS